MEKLRRREQARLGNAPIHHNPLLAEMRGKQQKDDLVELEIREAKIKTMAKGREWGEPRYKDVIRRDRAVHKYSDNYYAEKSRSTAEGQYAQPDDEYE